jgi:DNA-3-methyladenine glycosylase I
MLERDGGLVSQTDVAGVKRRCAWVTANLSAILH